MKKLIEKIISFFRCEEKPKECCIQRAASKTRPKAYRKGGSAGRKNTRRKS